MCVAGEKTKVYLNQRFYFYSLLIAGVIGYLTGWLGWFAASEKEHEVAAVARGSSLLCVLYGGIVLIVFLYRAWQVIPREEARTSPAKAVGFLFIPLFNLYWMFQAIWGFAKDFNGWNQKRNLAIRHVPESLALWICILVLACFLPYVGLVARPIRLLLTLIFVSIAGDSINRASSFLGEGVAQVSLTESSSRIVFASLLSLIPAFIIALGASLADFSMAQGVAVTIIGLASAGYLIYKFARTPPQAVESEAPDARR